MAAAHEDDAHLRRLDDWIADQLPGFGAAPLQWERVRGGASNVIYRLRRAERSWLLRRPPAVTISGSAHDMGREIPRAQG